MFNRKMARIYTRTCCLGLYELHELHYYCLAILLYYADSATVSVGEEQYTCGVFYANLQYSYSRYISLWITLIISQPPLSHTSREPDAQSPTVLSRIKINYY
jgi:hypothetical protein